MDNISVNFKKNIFVGNRKSNEKRIMLDNYSVVSAITKGGTIVNRSNYSNQGSNTKINQKSRNQKDQTYRSRFKENENDITGTPEPNVMGSMEKISQKSITSLTRGLKTYGQGYPDDDELQNEVGKTLQRGHAKMMSVYCKKPYKVMSID